MNPDATVDAPDHVADGESVGATQAPAPLPSRPRRRIRRRWLALGALGVGVVGWVGWGSPATLVEHVVVVAPRGVSEEAIRLASGISAHDHVPAVDADRVREAVMAAIPAVADVQVQRSLPHTIRLEVSTRTPLAVVPSGKGYEVLDPDGVVYDKVAKAKKLPVIKARTDVGQETAIGVLLSLPATLRAEVRRVTASTRDDVTLTLAGGSTVRWGSAQDAALKARVLAGLVAVKADKYDVSSPLQPTTTGGETSEGSATS